MASSIPYKPQTLQEWRSGINQPEEVFPRSLWTPLESFFSSQGYTLWRPQESLTCLKPHNDEPRTQDEYVCKALYDDDHWYNPQFGMLNSIHCPARTADNRDVLIRLMAIGIDRGEKHRAALSRLVADDNVSNGNNHIVPMLKEIVHDDMIFGVFPLMSAGFQNHWYHQFSEVIDVIKQVLEGIAFCHENLVAHLDLDDDNILINWAGGKCQVPGSSADGGKVTPFRSYSSVRYYINDFELAVTFDPDSKPSSRVVTGFPTTGIRTGEYARAAAPEMLSGTPYSPFLADVWQLGTMLKSHFGHLGHLSQPLVELFDDMCAEDPKSRPSASEALKRVEQLNPPSHVLVSEVPNLKVGLTALSPELDVKVASRAAPPLTDI